jgi:LacI family transcriptional regulator
MPRPSKREPQQGRQISQRAIGELAGVSQATVSLVLAGRTVNSEETRQRVLSAAKQLHYRPNLLVHGMQTGKSKMIGVMAPPYDYYWSRILYGIHDELAENDYVPITVWPTHNGREIEASSGYETNELSQIHRLLDRRVDGVILWPPTASLFSDHVSEFSSRDLPMVTIDHILPATFHADSVGSDETGGGKLVADHLTKLGHRYIGHIAGPNVTSWGRLRRQAFEQALAAIPKTTCITYEAPAGHPTLATEQIRAMLSLKNRPTAIYAASDLLARVVCRVATSMGIEVTRDLSVVGFSDDDFAAELNPPLTTVRQDAYRVGRRAAQIVIGRAGGALGKRALHEALPVELVVRGSTAAVGPLPVG